MARQENEVENDVCKIVIILSRPNMLLILLMFNVISNNTIRVMNIWYRHRQPSLSWLGWVGSQCLKGIHRHISLSHYNNVIMGAIASQITSLTIIYSDTDQRKHQSSASLAFVWGIHRDPVNSPHKRPVTRKMFPFDDVIMWLLCLSGRYDTIH